MFYGFHGGGAGIAIFIAFIVVRMFMRGGWNDGPRDRDRQDPPDDRPPLDM